MRMGFWSQFTYTIGQFCPTVLETRTLGWYGFHLGLALNKVVIKASVDTTFLSRLWNKLLLVLFSHQLYWVPCGCKTKDLVAFFVVQSFFSFLQLYIFLLMSPLSLNQPWDFKPLIMFSPSHFFLYDDGIHIKFNSWQCKLVKYIPLGMTLGIESPALHKT